MKDFKEMESIELKDFGVRVNPYLPYKFLCISLDVHYLGCNHMGFLP